MRSKRQHFEERYLSGQTPWDSGITPPEITALIESGTVQPARALDLGCGTGTTSIYLARAGWQVVGVDFAAAAIRVAQTKAEQAGVTSLTAFRVADVLDPGTVVDGPFRLTIDIGCGHSFSAEDWAGYAAQVAELMEPGGIWMVFSFLPTPDGSMGLEPEFIKRTVEGQFDLRWSVINDDTASGLPSAWHKLIRL